MDSIRFNNKCKEMAIRSSCWLKCISIGEEKKRPQDQKIVHFLLLSILLTSWTTFIMGGYEMYKKNRKGEADSALSHHIQCALTKGGDTHTN